MEDLYIAGKVGPFRYYHHPLNHYINSIISAGWELREMREWSIDMKEHSQYFNQEKLAVKRTDKVPLFAFFACEKPYV